MMLELDGFWNECKGRNEHTHFWQFVEADNNTGHFMYHWEKLADGTMRYTRFNIRFFWGEQGQHMANIMHPLAISQHIQGLPYSDVINAYYLVEKSKGTVTVGRMTVSRSGGSLPGITYADSLCCILPGGSLFSWHGVSKLLQWAFGPVRSGKVGAKHHRGAVTV